MNIVLSIVMLAAIALLIGAFAMWRKTGQIKQPLLMVLLAVIFAVNIAIWTVPDASGDVPLAQIED